MLNYPNRACPSTAQLQAKPQLAPLIYLRSLHWPSGEILGHYLASASCTWPAARLCTAERGSRLGWPCPREACGPSAAGGTQGRARGRFLRVYVTGGSSIGVRTRRVVPA